MLTPEYLDGVAAPLQEIFSELQGAIQQDIARRIANADFTITETAKWQIIKLQETGESMSAIQTAIAKSLNLSEKEIKSLFKTAGVKSLKTDIATQRAAIEAGVLPAGTVPLAASAAFAQVMNAIGDVVGKIWAFIEPLGDAVWEGFKTAINGIVDALLAMGGWLAEHQGIVKVFLEGFALVKTTQLAIAITKLGILTAQQILNNAQWEILRIKLALSNAQLIINNAQWTLLEVKLGITTAAQWLANAATTAWNIISGAAATATMAFGAAMNFLAANPIILVIAAIVALVAGIILLVKHWDKVKEAAAACWEWISGVWNKVAAWFNTNVIQPIVGFFTGLWDGIVGIFQGIVNWVKDNWQSIVLFIINPFAGVFNYLYEHFEGFRNFVNGVVQAVVGFFTGAWAAISETAISVWTSISTFFTNLWASISGAAIGAWNAISNFFTGLWDAIVNAALFVWNLYVAGLQLIWDTISSAVITAWTAIKDFFSTILSSIETVFTTVWDGIKTVWSVVATWFTDNVITPIQNAFNGFKTIIIGVWDAIWGGIKGVINSILGGVESFVNGIVNGVNLLIAGLNAVIGLGSKVTEALGLGGIGSITPWNTVKLPRLAQGAVIPPNREFAAILGDQRSGTNIETPLDTMIAAFKTALSEMDIGNGTGDITINMPVYLDNEKIYEGQQKVKRRRGTSATKVGA